MSQHLFRRILTGGAVITAGRLIGIASNFGLTAILARVLARDDMGLYFLAFNLATFFSIFARFGSEQAALKLFSDRINGQGTGQLLRLAQQFSVIMFVSICGLTAAFLIFGDWIFRQVLDSASLASVSLLLLAWAVLLGIQAVNAEIFRAFKRFILASAFKGPLASVLTLLLVLVVWLNGSGLDFREILLLIIGIQFAASATGALIVLFLCQRLDSGTPRDNNTEIGSRDIVALAAPLFASQIALYIATQSDLWLLQAFGSPGMVANYGAAARLVLFTGLAMQIANAVLPPFISQLRVQGDIARMENMLRFTATVSSVPAILITVVFFGFPDFILAIVYGNEYLPAANVLMILSAGQLINVMAGSCGYVLVMYGHSRLLMNISLISGALSVITAYLFIKSGYGIESVAFAYLAGAVCQQAVMLFMARRLCGVFTHFGVFKWAR